MALSFAWVYMMNVVVSVRTQTRLVHSAYCLSNTACTVKSKQETGCTADFSALQAAAKGVVIIHKGSIDAAPSEDAALVQQGI